MGWNGVGLFRELPTAWDDLAFAYKIMLRNQVTISPISTWVRLRNQGMYY